MPKLARFLKVDDITSRTPLTAPQPLVSMLLLDCSPRLHDNEPIKPDV